MAVSRMPAFAGCDGDTHTSESETVARALSFTTRGFLVAVAMAHRLSAPLNKGRSESEKS